MADYINREVTLKILTRIADCVSDSRRRAVTRCIREIASLAPANVEPVRHGKWNIRRSRRSALCLVCSVCGRNVDNDDLGILLEFGEYGVARHLYPYCHCGAKMCLEGENNDD